MRTISRTTQFRRDFKREIKGRYRLAIDGELPGGIEMLAGDVSLPHRLRDHALGGEYQDCRDCHIRPDLVLIYRLPDDHILELIRLGSHSELSL